MKGILRQTLRFALLGGMATGAAWAQSPPPTPDPAKTRPASEQTQAGQQKPIEQKDTVNPKNSKEDVEAIGNRSVGKGINLYSLEHEIALGKGLAQEVERSSKLIDDPVATEYTRAGTSPFRSPISSSIAMPSVNPTSWACNTCTKRGTTPTPTCPSSSAFRPTRSAAPAPSPRFSRRTRRRRSASRTHRKK